MAIYESYNDALKELNHPAKKEYQSFKVMRLEDGAILHDDLSLQQLKDLGFPRPTFNHNTVESEGNIVARKDTGEDAYKRDLQAYTDRRNEIMDQFKNALFEDVGLTSEKERKIGDIIYSQAFEDGHSNGLSEIESLFYEYEEMVDRILKVAEKG